MKKIRVYDMDALIQKEHPEYEAFRYKKVAIFEGPRGVILAEHEAAHQRENLITDSVVIPLNKVPPKGHIALMASADLRISLDEIVSKAPYFECSIEEFFDRRNYNPRCQSNYSLLMSNLRNIGFDLHGYFEEPSIEEQIANAQVKQSLQSKEESSQERISGAMDEPDRAH